MAAIDRQLSRGLAYLTRQQGQGTVQVRQGEAGEWGELPQALLHISALVPGFSDTLSQEQRAATATLTVPWDGLVLGETWRVRQADGTTWAVTSGPHGSSARIYELTRITTTRHGANRGRLTGST